MVKRGLIGKKVIFVLVFVIALLSFTSAAHSQYPDFFESHNTNINNNVLSVSDTIIYDTGYYSANGGAWTEYNLQGNYYTGSSSWILDSASANLPSALSGSGTHYVLYLFKFIILILQKQFFNC